MQAYKVLLRAKKVLEKCNIVPSAGFKLRLFGLEIQCTTNCTNNNSGLMAVLAYISPFHALV